MRKAIAALAILGLGAAAAAQDEMTRTNLSCRATHQVECRGGVCQSEADDFIQVTVNVVLESGAGNICTYTYCRDFMLTPAPGETVDEAVARWTGFTLSTSRGSTEEHIGRPAIDYQLSLSEDRTQFFLGGANDGGFGGWTGACTAESAAAE
ncbi:MAG: hypothetical protein GC206_15375 [Alphaproteobacteria bacterium]|nr:hypothetical protein [Alphaproteobacteria bacterium]